MLVDMNSFFASVEQQANPFLRGRPCGVAASIHATSCLIATSKEAKAMGIKTATSIYKARKICPDIVVLKNEPEKYREVSRRVNQIFNDYTPQVEPYSIDESFLDLGESKQSPLIVGAEIKRRIREEVGEWLTCSVGIGPNKFIAKLAAEYHKPDGLSVLWASQLREVYRGKKLSDLWGIGRGWTRRLAALGIFTPVQLMDYPLANLMASFGKPGYYLWQKVNGLDEDQIISEEDLAKSFGNSWVLNFRSTDKNLLAPVVLRLAEKAARRMRREGFVSSCIYLSLRLADGGGFHRSQRLPFTVSTGMELYKQAMEIWQPWKLHSPVMHIAVGFSGLRPKMNQISFWPEAEDHLTPALDKINDKYGEMTIRSALLAGALDYAPDSIAFGK
jgi:DNA polymerase-4